MPQSDYNVNITIATTDKTSGPAKKAAKGLNAAALAAKAMAGAMVARQVVKYAVELTKLGAAAERQATALDNLAAAAGTSGDAIVSAIRMASDFTIDRMTAMQAASRAMVMDVADSPAEFERLTKVATALGRAMGQDAAKSIDDFVTAAGRQSKLVADNLGLIVNAEDAYLRFAEANNITVGSMDDAAKKAAFLAEMLRQGEIKMLDLGDATLGMAGQMEQASAAWEDTRVSIGRSLAMFASSTGILSGLSKAARENVVMMELEARGFGSPEMMQGAIATAKAMGDVNAATEIYIGLMRAAAGEGVSAAEGQRLLRGEIEQAAPTQYQIADATGKSVEAFNQYSMALEGTRQAEEQSALSALALEQAERAATQAAQEATATQLDLAASLKGATEAQVASAAIGELKKALDKGEITFDTYATAVEQTQIAFGLADEKSVFLSENIAKLTDNLSDGVLSADDFDEALQNVITQSESAGVEVGIFNDKLDALTSKTHWIRVRVDMDTTPLAPIAGGGTTQQGPRGTTNNTNINDTYNFNTPHGPAAVLEAQRRQRRRTMGRVM